MEQFEFNCKQPKLHKDKLNSANDELWRHAYVRQAEKKDINMLDRMHESEPDKTQAADNFIHSKLTKRTGNFQNNPSDNILKRATGSNFSRKRQIELEMLQHVDNQSSHDRLGHPNI